MKFDLVLTNPPFQDRTNRGRTPHKLWIDFTLSTFERLLDDGGTLCQVSPGSFRSPSNRVLDLLKSNCVDWIDLETDQFFPEVASTFASYAIRKESRSRRPTCVFTDRGSFEVKLSPELFYLPNDICAESLALHRKIIFDASGTLDVEHDYVTCHNILLRKGDSLSRVQTVHHPHPVFHTNKQVWWSSIRQKFADAKKVMWTRSGYTKPFFDNGEMGGTDMAYFVRVGSDVEGEALAHNLNSKPMRYIFQSARWSGFGNEKVFHALPRLPADRPYSDSELADVFQLTRKEMAYVERCLG